MKKETQEEVIKQQIQDMKSFGIKLSKEQQRYVASCLLVVWTTANLEGFKKGAHV